MTIVGNLGNDPDVRYAQNGNAITTISVATSESWKDKDGNMQERTEWHRIKFFGKLAEIAGEYLKKGSQVYVEGSLRTEKYQDKDTGQDRYSTDIVGRELQMLGGRRESDGAGDAAAPRAGQRPPQGGGRSAPPSGGGRPRAPVAGPGAQRGSAPPPTSNEPFPDDDLPFRPGS